METQEQFTNTLSYIATCVSMVCGGTTSLFATYGSSFGEILGFTQYETNLVASLGDYAHYMSAPLFGYVASRAGPTRVIQTAGVLMAAGYLGLSWSFGHAAVGSTHGSQRVATLSLLFALVGVGSKAAYMASMATTASNFKYSRHAGVALGIPLSLYGLSTFVFSSIKAHWFERDSTPERFLAFIAAVSGAAHIMASWFVTLKDSSQLAVAGAARRRAQSAPRPGADRGSGKEVASSESIELAETRRRRMTTSVPNEDGADQPISGGGADQPISAGEAAPAEHPGQGPGPVATGTTLAPAAVAPQAREAPIFVRFRRDPMAWALLLGLVCFSGPGLVFVNNCGTMVRALSHGSGLTEEQVGQYKDKIVATQSFFSFAARLGVGYLSDVWRTRLRLPRAALLVAAALLMIHAQTAAARVGQLEDIFSLAVQIGVAMGSVFTLAPTITSETWGADNFGICWGIITLGPAVGGHVCNLVFGHSWDAGQARIVARMGPQGNAQCDSECFAPAFVTTVKIAYMGLFFFAAVLCMPRAVAMWKPKK
ncbi:hypothetical protein GGF46_004177 [Coemansia sp. RSA 552]|nr:hypothetical protein GGF46_004177 [Coemansia sp. RSA 552]